MTAYSQGAYSKKDIKKQLQEIGVLKKSPKKYKKIVKNLAVLLVLGLLMGSLIGMFQKETNSKNHAEAAEITVMQDLYPTK